MFVDSWCTKYSEMGYARSGNKAINDVTLDAGEYFRFEHFREQSLIISWGWRLERKINIEKV